MVTNISEESAAFLFTLEMIMFLMQRKWPLSTINDQNGPLSYSLSLTHYRSTSLTYLFRPWRWTINEPPKLWNPLTSLQVGKIQKATIWLLINLPNDWRKNERRKYIYLRNGRVTVNEVTIEGSYGWNSKCPTLLLIHCSITKMCRKMTPSERESAYLLFVG